MTVAPLALDRALQTRLLQLTAREVAPPHVDPHVAALAALGVVDFARGEGKDRFEELVVLGALQPAKLDDLEELAEALLKVVEAFEEAPRAGVPVTVPPSVDVEARALRSQLHHLLETHLAADVPAVERALLQVRRAYGPFDLAIDLRVLASLVDQHQDRLASAAGFSADLTERTRTLARAVEEALHAHDTPAQRDARAALHRVWALFERTYSEIATLGREIFKDGDAICPTLEAIAQIERTARRASSSRRPAAEIVAESLPSIRAAAARSVAPSSRRARSLRPPTVAQDVAKTALEVDLGHDSDSNLWLGFSQDIVDGGIFVATYAAAPQGAPVELTVHLDGRDAPLQLQGVVHWRREAHAGEDLPAGLGLRFLDLAAEHARLFQDFAAKRTPIFYDD